MTNIPIFLSSDNNYAPFVATTIASICDNTKSFCDFYILDGGITKENKAKIYELKKIYDNFSIEFIKININDFFNDFKVNMHFTKSMYSRFLIANLKPEIKKAIYSDVDVVVLDDIQQMYNENLDNYIIGAVWERNNEQTINKEKINLFNLSKQHKFFSSGNLLLDCEAWKKNFIFEKLLELEKQYREVLKMPDQDLLNICFNNNYKLLPRKYCCVTSDVFSENKIDKIVIRHFDGLLKPWLVCPDINIDYPQLSNWWFYAKKTSFYAELYQNACKPENIAKAKRFLIVQKTLTKNLKTFK